MGRTEDGLKILWMLSTYIFPISLSHSRRYGTTFCVPSNFYSKLKRTRTEQKKSHDLGFWCVNFIDTTAIPTVERLRNTAKLATKRLATQTFKETVKKRPDGLLNKQVSEVLKSCSPDISASEIAGILNKNYVAEYEPTSPCAVGKTRNWKKHSDEKKKSLVKSK